MSFSLPVAQRTVHNIIEFILEESENQLDPAEFVLKFQEAEDHGLDLFFE